MSDPGVDPDMGRRFTVLFTEDDRLVRDAVAELLRQHGFEVIVATDGRDAMRKLAERPVDLLFTDIVMPGISGYELARQAKLMQPNLQVLFMTGHFGHSASSDGIRYGKLLEKPLRADEILSEVVQALAR